MLHRRHGSQGAFAAALAVLATMALTGAALAQPVVGFTEEFNAGDGGWTGGSIYTLIATGGVGGAADGYLKVATTVVGKLGVHADPAMTSNYAGDYIAAGIDKVHFWLNDIGTDENLELHFSIGNGSNFWQLDTGFLPPLHAWTEYIVTLNGPTGWTHIINPLGETWDQALRNVDRLHVRHDNAPYIQTPNSIRADFGIDRIMLDGPGPVGVDPSPFAGQPVLLAAPYPNPSRGPVTFAMTQAKAGEVRIEIVDVAGRRVRAEVLPAAGVGPRTWLWDGLDQNGNRVAPGSYRVRARSDEGGTSRPLVRVE